MTPTRRKDKQDNGRQANSTTQEPEFYARRAKGSSEPQNVTQIRRSKPVGAAGTGRCDPATQTQEPPGSCVNGAMHKLRTTVNGLQGRSTASGPWTKTWQVAGPDHANEEQAGTELNPTVQHSGLRPCNGAPRSYRLETSLGETEQQAVGHHKAIAARENTVRGEPQPRARAREGAGRKDTTPLAVRTRAVELAGALETSKLVRNGKTSARTAQHIALHDARRPTATRIEPLKRSIIPSSLSSQAQVSSSPSFPYRVISITLCSSLPLLTAPLTRHWWTVG